MIVVMMMMMMTICKALLIFLYFDDVDSDNGVGQWLKCKIGGGGTLHSGLGP